MTDYSYLITDLFDDTTEQNHHATDLLYHTNDLLHGLLVLLCDAKGQDEHRFGLLCHGKADLGDLKQLFDQPNDFFLGQTCRENNFSVSGFCG